MFFKKRKKLSKTTKRTVKSSGRTAQKPAKNAAAYQQHPVRLSASKLSLQQRPATPSAAQRSTTSKGFQPSAGKAVSSTSRRTGSFRCIDTKAAREKNGDISAASYNTINDKASHAEAPRNTISGEESYYTQNRLTFFSKTRSLHRSTARPALSENSIFRRTQGRSTLLRRRRHLRRPIPS